MTTENKKPLIEVKNLRMEFHNDCHNMVVFSDIDETFYEGEVSFIIGPSGAGKSTFLRCLNRLETATASEIYFEGVNILNSKVDIDRHRQKMGMVFQQFRVFQRKRLRSAR